MKKDVLLTVAESKRLIAKGVARFKPVVKAKKDGIVVVATGTTNGYVYEELLDKKIDKRRYTSGAVLPKKGDARKRLPAEKLSDLVLRKGKIDKGLDRFTAVAEMGPGDVFIKGCNALNYEKRIAGILIGDRKGGTIGSAIGHIVGKRITLVLPVGLEKEIAGNILENSRLLHSADAQGPRMMPIGGEIITEIEALEILCGIKATHIASGGVGGAEGAVWLLLQGEEKPLTKALALIDEIQGEPPWLG
ncbi:MAG: hypothetical protein AMS15_03105 [Planctomycetes bacterium DG_23]|nr:MAG: hypothetical protein AMS15_03105 [Planctomycetes bacterium DG_23]